MSNEFPISTSRALLQDLVTQENVKVKQVAMACKISVGTLNALLKGTHADLNGRNFNKLFHFYLAVRLQKV